MIYVIFHFTSSKIITLRFFSVLLCPISFICPDLSFKIYDAFGLFLPKFSTLQFSQFSLIPDWLVHSVTATRFFCILLKSTSLLMTDNSFESLAKSFISHKAVSGRSLMYTTKIRWSKTEPC